MELGYKFDYYTLKAMLLALQAELEAERYPIQDSRQRTSSQLRLAIAALQEALENHYE